MLLPFFTQSGRVFHMHGPMDLNEPLCTNSVLDLEVYNNHLCVDLKFLLWGNSLSTISVRYPCMILWAHLNIILATL